MVRMYIHPEASRRQEDDRAAAKAARDLAKLRAEAARRVPGWSPEVRQELRDMFKLWRSSYYY